MSQSVHLVIPDLFPPAPYAASLCEGLALPALETLLARAQRTPQQAESLEAWLGVAFAAEQASIACITRQASGGEVGSHHWLRADPVHLRIEQDRFILQRLPDITEQESRALCEALNRHVESEGLYFIAADAQRWYLRLDARPDVVTQPVDQVAGEDVRRALPQGDEALRWNRLMNEAQMLWYEHPVNQAREAAGNWTISGIWLWGEGRNDVALTAPAAHMVSDSELASAYAQAAGMPCAAWPDAWAKEEGTSLLVYTALRETLRRGDVEAWRRALQTLEIQHLQPMMRALRRGVIEKLTLDVPRAEGGLRYQLTRADVWKLWRRPMRFSTQPLV